MPAEAQAASFTWDGEGATPHWSEAANWEGGLAPGGAVETLTFSARGCREPACDSEDDIPGLQARGLAFAQEPEGEGQPVLESLTGERLELGAGGIAADGYGAVDQPIELSAAQTWSAQTGPEHPAPISLYIDGAVSGEAADALRLATSGKGSIQVLGSVDAGPITLAEGAAVSLAGYTTAEAQLDAADERQVTVDPGAVLTDLFEGATGPLEVEGTVETAAVESGSVVLHEDSLRLAPQGRLAISVEAASEGSTTVEGGAVDLEGGSLALPASEPGGDSDSCEALKPGEVDTLIRASSVTGTFAGVPDGAVVSLGCPFQQIPATARIDYSATAVTATILTAGGGAPAVTPETHLLGGGLPAPALTTSTTQTVATVPAPVLARTSNLRTVSGHVRVRLPGSTRFVELSALASIPYGALVDTTHGTVALTAADAHGGTQTIDLSEGEFVPTQSSGGAVVAKLAGGDFASCPTARERALGARSSSRRAGARHVVRKLWGSTQHAEFGTRAGTVSTSGRDPRWLTEDLCEGSLVHVASGSVEVTNLITRRRLTLTAGHSYLARLP